MSDDIRKEPVILFLRMDPSWVFVDDIRRFVESFCAAACPGAEREQQLALAAHELVQNAISWASEPGVDLRLAVDREARRVRVSVSNVTRPEQLEVLRERLAAIAAYPDPLDAYVAAMREDPGRRGGLGLPRVRYEAALELEVTHEDDRVTVHAHGPLEQAPQAFIPSPLARHAAAARA
ncbi:MAG TPA: ATP-binding protein [Anaeromyxobacter sp.]|nr:ATP-binding protein [Anaeromyxobacter sp.]